MFGNQLACNSFDASQQSQNDVLYDVTMSAYGTYVYVVGYAYDSTLGHNNLILGKFDNATLNTIFMQIMNTSYSQTGFGIAT